MIRAYGVFNNWQILIEFGANPAYILTTACVWILIGLWLFQTIIRRFRYGVRSGLAVAGLYYLWYWGDRLFIQPSPAPNLIFSAVVSTVLLAIFSIIIILPATRAFFKQENR
jgi:hypothetical protein